MIMSKNEFAVNLYGFLKDNDALGHLENISAADAIAELEETLSDLQMVNEMIRDIEEISDMLDDHEVYVAEVKPLLCCLREMQGKLEAEQRRRMVADTGYEVKHAIHVGDREIILAENMQDPDGNFYMKAEYTENGIVGQYDHVIVSPSYLCIMEEFVSSLDRQMTALRKELPNYAPAPITAEQCTPNDYRQSIKGMVVAIRADALRPEYRRGDVQMVLVTGGFGANANSRGSAVFCRHLNNGEHARFDRSQVLGVVKELPDWAKERLAAVKVQMAAENAKSKKDRGDAR